MKIVVQNLWASAVLFVALRKIVDVLPDWATFVAILALPLLSAWSCPSRRGDAKMPLDIHSC